MTESPVIARPPGQRTQPPTGTSGMEATLAPLTKTKVVHRSTAQRSSAPLSPLKAGTAGGAHPGSPGEAGSTRNAARMRALPLSTACPAMPGMEAWVRAVAVAVVDVLAGRRDVRSIQRWLAPRPFSQLCKEARARKHSGSTLPGWAVSSRVFPTDKGDYDFTATIWDHDRARAVAGRIVQFRGRWLVTEVETR